MQEKRAKGGFLLLLCIMGVLFFITVLGPALEAPLGLKKVGEFIDERNINANMYFYTEVEQFAEAGINMDNTMTYPPRAVAGR